MIESSEFDTYQGHVPDDTRSRTILITALTAAAVGVATTLVWTVIMWTSAWQYGYDPTETWMWARWDSGWYQFIAEKGYYIERCNAVPNRGPEDFCGSAGWFPLYPYGLRILNTTGIGIDVLGRWVAVLAMTTTYAMLWLGFLRRHTALKQCLILLLCAAFPSAVYYGAMFPVSIVTASTIACLVMLQRDRFLLAGLCAMAAVAAYPSGLFVPIASALVPLTASRLGRGVHRLRASLLVAVPGILMYFLVTLNFWRTTGRWDAWFRIQETYGYSITFPAATIRNQFKSIIDGATPNAIGLQTAFILVLVILTGVTAWKYWSELGLGERAVVPVVAALWLAPLTLGGELSLYRAESLLLPVVILLVRCRTEVLAALAIIAVPLTYFMAQLFFRYILV